MRGKRARRHFSQLSEFERSLIIGMKTAGWSTCRVPGQVDRSECAVINCWEQCTREEKTGSGATRKTTRREDRRIVRQALVDPTVTRSTIRADVGVAIVPQTISRHLAEANLKSKRPFRALPFTPEHRQLRLQWCQARSMRNVTDWQKVVLSDESRFFGTDDNRVWVWRCPAYDSRSTLIVMCGTLTGQRYVDDILRPHVGPFLDGLPGTIFQQDNARHHTARVAQDFLHHFQTLTWPARSLDLSPVEHVPSEKWKPRRKLLNPCFHHDMLKQYLEVFNANSRIVVKLFKEETEKEFSDVRKPLTRVAMDTICETMLGSSTRTLENTNLEYIKAAGSYTRAFGDGPRHFKPWSSDVDDT
ncbi:transposable element Tc1 transposase [Trichonephila clavipes]|nr:transposable element Tc1 transposase [Trichonephila clavipes]